MENKALQECFVSLCRRYAGERGALWSEEDREKNALVFTCLFPNIKMQLVYRTKGSAGVPVSTLYARVYPDKNCPVYLHLPRLLPLIEVEDYRACYFPYLETETRMEACFRELTCFLNTLLPILEEICAKGGDVQLLRRFLLELSLPEGEVEEILKAGTWQQKNYVWFQESREDAHISRFTAWNPCQAFLTEEPKKALRLYQKQKVLFPYEQGLCAFLKTPEGRDFSPMPRECNALLDMKQSSCGREDVLTPVKTALVLYLGFSLIFCCFLGAVQFLCARGTLCWFGVQWYYGFLLAGLPAIFGGIALRRNFMPLLNRKHYRTQLAFDKLVNPRWVTTFAMGVFALVIVISLLIGVEVTGCQLRMYPDHWVRAESWFSRQTYRYEDVEAIYYIHARYNDYGDRIERPSYILALQDGTIIDLDGITSTEETEEKILHLFQSRGLKITELDSDQELL